MSKPFLFKYHIAATVLLLFMYGCNIQPLKIDTHIAPAGNNIMERITVPDGYARIVADSNSFGGFLRYLKLKPNGAPVHYFNGSIKDNHHVYVAVVDMPIGNKDLQQCADAVMHLRAEYLYTHDMQEKIHFTFTNGFRADYSKWAAGYRIAIDGNKTKWVKTAQPEDSRAVFDKYMEIVYSYCGSLSLSREMNKINYDQLQPGDVLVRGGTPGHAEIVVDVAVNKAGKKVYLLAESAMPAQEIQILTDPMSAALSPWYEQGSAADQIITAEGTFTGDQLMRFED